MTSNLVVAGSSPAGGAGQDNIGAGHLPYVGLYAEVQEAATLMENALRDLATINRVRPDIASLLDDVLVMRKLTRATELLTRIAAECNDAPKERS